MSYSYLKLIHLVAVVLFMGNIITGLFWMAFAVKTKDLKIMNHTIKGIIKAERYFTIPGVIVITTGGFLAAIYGRIPILGTGWIFWSLVLFSISGLVFSFKTAALQTKIYKLTISTTPSGDFNWAIFHKIYLEWSRWRLIGILAPLAAFVMMTLKIPQ